jgi:para-aminobenzoate synthetase component 1
MMHVREIAWCEPALAASACADDPYCAFLDSAADGDPRSRYSYVCTSPFLVVEAAGASVTVNGRAAAGNPFSVLEGELARWRVLPGEAPVPFLGGAVGMLGYELGGWLERLPQRHADLLGIPDMVFGFYDVVLAFDRAARRCWVLSSGFPEIEPGARRARAAARAEALVRRLEPAPAAKDVGGWHCRWRADFEPAAYEERIRRVLDYIRAGDIFQANFTMRFQAARPPGLRPFDLYTRLRALSPAPFAAFLSCGPKLGLASVSPERFLRLSPDGRIETRPIKGTRPRHADPAVDEQEARALMASEKDRAENLMIVDLMRNDIGRVSEVGSVGVPVLFGLESFASVHHLVSVVQGQLRSGLGPVDLLRATFPGGSVTGAPKVRAMEIINELEASRRGPYCGSVAWIGFDGAMDSSIVIRTLVLTEAAVVAQAGGGIVADSNPGAEYEELLVKVLPLLRALEGIPR